MYFNFFPAEQPLNFNCAWIQYVLIYQNYIIPNVDGRDGTASQALKETKSSLGGPHVNMEKIQDKNMPL